MPGSTASGFPYPLGTEPVRDGDNAIKNLADAIESRIGGMAWWGVAGLKTTDANGIAVWSALPFTTIYGAVSNQAEINGSGVAAAPQIHRCIVGTGVPAQTVYVKVFNLAGAAVANTSIGITTIIWGKK